MCWCAYTVEARGINLRMPMGLEGIEDRGAIGKVRGADLFLAFATKRHGAEYDGESSFGRHVRLLEVIVSRKSRDRTVAVISAGDNFL
jgi:hypothetical protein